MQFIATARGDVDSDGEDDVWIITEEGTPQHVEVD